jgi:hypothetical protein
VGLDLGLCLQGHTKWVGDFSTFVGVYKDGNKWLKGAHRAKRGIHCSLDHLESLVRRSEKGGFGAACLGALVHGVHK